MVLKKGLPEESQIKAIILIVRFTIALLRYGKQTLLKDPQYNQAKSYMRIIERT
jgi:hypothetical protein